MATVVDAPKEVVMENKENTVESGFRSDILKHSYTSHVDRPVALVVREHLSRGRVEAHPLVEGRHVAVAGDADVGRGGGPHGVPRGGDRGAGFEGGSGCSGAHGGVSFGSGARKGERWLGSAEVDGRLQLLGGISPHNHVLGQVPLLAQVLMVRGLVASLAVVVAVVVRLVLVGL